MYINRVFRLSGGFFKTAAERDFQFLDFSLGFCCLSNSGPNLTNVAVGVSSMSGFLINLCETCENVDHLLSLP